ncbi:type II/IV secretion system protein TadC [Desulfocucumis palustris]|uniref:Type II/IV secretion system protein TadC n=1 Tax=Desulfocucumis palustris TaxID=1898651 RepID=A0A2L2XCA5_9FIRM|nr:type II secretion system F family protein [Desulfocucumis palustris]GBF33967.1 type II/IV secretion system protein TadC [Desulfocucumis palustris]
MIHALTAGLSVFFFILYLDAGRRPAAVSVKQKVDMLQLKNNAKNFGVSFFGPLVPKVFGEDVIYSVNKKLVWAGIDNITTIEFLALKIAAVFLLPVIGFVLSPVLGYDPLFAIMLGGAGYILPESILNSRVKARQKEIKARVLDFASLLATTLEAGGGDIYNSLVMIGSRLGGELGKEVDKAVHDVRTGKNPNDALINMAERCGVDDMTQLMRIINTANKYGTKVSDTINSYVTQIRTLRRYEAEKIANEAAVKMVFPMLVFIIAPLMFMLAYPAFQQLGSILG